MRTGEWIFPCRLHCQSNNQQCRSTVESHKNVVICLRILDMFHWCILQMCRFFFRGTSCSCCRRRPTVSWNADHAAAHDTHTGNTAVADDSWYSDHPCPSYTDTTVSCYHDVFIEPERPCCRRSHSVGRRAG